MMPVMIDTGTDVDRELQAGIALCRGGDWKRGLPLLAELAGKRSTLPGVALSYLGYGMASQQRQVRDGRELCRRAAASDFYQPEVLYNLARVEHLAHNRREAVKALEAGLKLDPDHAGMQELKKQVGVRRKPVLGFLARGNFLNVFLGRLRHLFRG
jgi:hypothetical protein